MNPTRIIQSILAGALLTLCVGLPILMLPGCGSTHTSKPSVVITNTVPSTNAPAAAVSIDCQLNLAALPQWVYFGAGHESARTSTSPVPIIALDGQPITFPRLGAEMWVSALGYFPGSWTWQAERAQLAGEPPLAQFHYVTNPLP